MSHVGPTTQDKEPVVARKKLPNAAAKMDEKAVNAARRAGADIDIAKKHNAGTNRAANNSTSLNTKRLDDDTENLAHERVPSGLKKSIMQGRMDKKLTQAQLAQMIKEKPQVIQDYESGKAIPNQQIIGKLERALGTKLRGKKDEKAVNAAPCAGTDINIVKKQNAGTNRAANNSTSLNTKRLDDDTENLAHERVLSGLKNSIMQGRMDKKLTQAQLAQMIKEKPQVIQDYESGKAIPNQQIIGKLERALGTKLRGKKDEKAVNAAPCAGTDIDIVKKHNAGTNRAGNNRTSLNTKRLDDDTENLAYERVTSDLKKSIMQDRMDKKLTQAQQPSAGFMADARRFTQRRSSSPPRLASSSALSSGRGSRNSVLPFVNKGKQIAPEKVVESPVTPMGFMADARRIRKAPATPSPRLASSSTAPKDGSNNLPCISRYRDETGLNFTLSPLGFGVKKPFSLHNEVYSELKHHQKEGLAWMWGIHCCGKGGLLADDMGLGKTRQILAFVAGLLQSNLIKKAIVAVPAMVVEQWIKELEEVGLAKSSYIFKDIKTRRLELTKVCELRGVLLTTHTLASNNWASLNVHWDYMIIDEAHKTCNKNNLKAYQNLDKIDSDHRILITGTPAPNNLKELRSLFDFCCPGLFSSMKKFNECYLQPLLEGNYDGSSSNQLDESSKASERLQCLIRPCFLRRMKKKLSSSHTPENKRLELPKKAEFVVWLKLSPYQEMLYRTFLGSNIIDKGNRGEIIVAATVLQKICNHPKELDNILVEGLNDDERVVLKQMIRKLRSMRRIWVKAIAPERFKIQNLRVVIFSRACEMLDVIEKVLANEGYVFSRIDGSLSSKERDIRIAASKEHNGPPIFLISSFCGGTGLDLPVASRAIIVEPFWNPCVDDQCADRIYRMGQQNKCIIYRLICSETIEETVYKTQISKLGVFKAATESIDVSSYISRGLGKELFKIPPNGFGSSRTLLKLEKKSVQSLSEEMNEELNFLKNGNIVGVSIHNDLFEGAPTRETRKSAASMNLYETNWDVDEDDLLRKEKANRVKFLQDEIQNQQNLLKSIRWNLDDNGEKLIKVINRYTEELSKLLSSRDPKDQT